MHEQTCSSKCPRDMGEDNGMSWGGLGRSGVAPLRINIIADTDKELFITLNKLGMRGTLTHHAVPCLSLGDGKGGSKRGPFKRNIEGGEIVM